MVLDSIHVKSDNSLLPTLKFLGQELVVDLPIPTLLLAAFGAVVALRYAYSVLLFILQLTLISGINIKTFQKRNAKTWAIVSGATSGIGLEFAKQLAAKGYNIIVLGRKQNVLEEICKDLETKFKVETRFVVVDFSNPSSREEKFAELKSTSEKLDIGILINNVGLSHEYPVSFVETEESIMDQIVQTNIMGTLLLTRLVLPQLLTRSSKSGSGTKSLILNVGSLSGRIPSPLLATYSCTKGGLQTWNKALGMELDGKGIMVRMVFPAFVVSNMSKIRKPSLLVPTPKTYVKSVLSSLGLSLGAQGRVYEMTAYPTHAVLDYLVSILGNFSEWLGMKFIHSMHVDIRKRALRKKERDAKKQ